MRNMLKDLFQRSGNKYDYQYDWVIVAEKKEKAADKNLEKQKEDIKEVWKSNIWLSERIYIHSANLFNQHLWLN